MIRKLFFFTILLCIGAVSFMALAERGVSHQLALLRKSQLSDINYFLDIDVPDTLSDPVAGVVDISFDFSGDADLSIDYGAKPDSTLLPLIVNGDEYTATLADEHIVIPNRLLTQGHNEVSVPFIASDKTINRHEDYLYTLFVPANARYAFPCFDQPDLKARFSVKLNAPDGWEVASNNTDQVIPTYLFSFIAGKFVKQTEEVDGIEMNAYYRSGEESNAKFIREACEILAFSIRWMEEYTGIPLPFEHFDFVVLPGYQFGGMEHPGIIQFNERRIFLSDNPTPDELNARFNLLAHETSHMWFGDMVTMKWFDDVWTKEVFANFMAAKIFRAMYPESDDLLNFVRSHYPLALNVDRTEGAHPIKQPLDNLDKAGLLYGNIIYHKAPLVMRMIENRVGEERLQDALKVYLQKFAYDNSTWDDLIAIIDSVAPDADIRQFDYAWVKQEGAPVVSCEYNGKKLVVTQSDPLDRGLIWPQPLKVGVYDFDDNSLEVIDINLNDAITAVSLDKTPDMVIPNLDGTAYGRFLMTGDFRIPQGLNPLQRLAVAANIYENFKLGNFDNERSSDLLIEMLMEETDEELASSLCSYLFSISAALPVDRHSLLDNRLYEVSLNHALPVVNKLLTHGLLLTAYSPQVCGELRKVWESQSNPNLSRKDYIKGAYHLALVYPDEWQQILSQQRVRLLTEDELREFDYIARGCNPDAATRKELFDSLIEPQNRINEPWAASLLTLLTDKSRAEDAQSLIIPGLDALPYIQQTSDIFFPGYWCDALLKSQISPSAQSTILSWLSSSPSISPFLLRKILTTYSYPAARPAAPLHPSCLHQHSIKR